MGDSQCPYVIEVGLPDGKQTIVAVSTAKDAVAALQQIASEYPDSVVLLYVNGLPVMEHGPVKH
jgi:hypothetical protein